MLEHQTDQRSRNVWIRAVSCPCVFRKSIAGNMKAILVVHVDDLLVLTVIKEAVETFVGELRSTLKIKDLGEASYYMGRHIPQDRVKQKLKFDQYLHARTITERFGVSKTAIVPSTPGGVKLLSKEHVPKPPEENDKMTNIPHLEVMGANEHRQ